MAICSNCNSESTRVLSRWSEDGTLLPDRCLQCSPESFERFTDPSDKKIWMGYEAHPNEYEKKYDKDGLIYERKPEYRSEQEQKLCESTAEEQESQARAIAKKRAERRTEPMTPTEQTAALRKAQEIASWIELAARSGRDVN